MNFHPVALREQRFGARQQHLREERELTRLGDRSKEVATKKMEFLQKQADRLMRFAEATRDPQLRAQLVIMSRAWVDQGANTRLRFKLLDAWRRYSSRPFPG
jgi:hypothetical protein